MAGERPSVYSIAAHRGFADALVAGLVPRYADPHLGLARLTLLLPSTRSARTMQEAFVRHYGQAGQQGLLLPRMVVVGDLDLDETLGPLIDSMGAGLDVPAAVDPVYRWLRLAELVRDARGDKAPPGSAPTGSNHHHPGRTQRHHEVRHWGPCVCWLGHADPVLSCRRWCSQRTTATQLNKTVWRSIT